MTQNQTVQVCVYHSCPLGAEEVDDGVKQNRRGEKVEANISKKLKEIIKMLNRAEGKTAPEDYSL